MVDKRIGVSDIVSQLGDGMTIGIGGWGGRRKPMALIREILRTDIKDLTIVAYGGPDVGLLCAAGKVRKLVFGFVSLDVFPLDSHFRKARQAGDFEVMEIDEGMLQWGLRAAAMRLPFLPTRVGLASDALALNPNIKTIRSPYADEEELVAMPALNLDVALVHANVADALGNARILGPDPFFDELMVRAADKAFLTCEKIVPTEALGGKEGARMSLAERSLITGVAEVPFGAHPTSCGPDYGIDVEHLKIYNGVKDEEAWQSYQETYLSPVTHEAYISAVGGADRIKDLPLPVF